MFLEFLLDVSGFLIKAVVICLVALGLLGGMAFVINKFVKNEEVTTGGRLSFEDLKKKIKTRNKLMRNQLKESDPDRKLKKKEKQLNKKSEASEANQCAEAAEAAEAAGAAETAAATEQSCGAAKCACDKAPEGAAQTEASVDSAKAEATETVKTEQTDAVQTQTQTGEAAEVKAEVKAEGAGADTATTDATVTAQADAKTETGAEAKSDAPADTQTAAAAVAAGAGAETNETKTTRCPFKKLCGGVSSKFSAIGQKKKDAKSKALAKLVEKQQKRQALVESLDNEALGGAFCPKNLFVVDFKGTKDGREVKELRLKIDAILDVATPDDEVIVNLNSPGGLVNSYGLCASQLKRLRDRDIYVTVTVDEVAASGGYLMASVANKIVAAPFAYIGSIGVIAGIPNFKKVLDRYNVEYEQITAGKYKRTLSIFGENTEEGRKKFKEELEAIHERFKEQVKHFRPQLDMDKVATGEHWLAVDALELGLVDELATSDEYIQQRVSKTYNSALKIKWDNPKKKKLFGKILPKVKVNAFSPERAKEELSKLEDDTFLNLK